MLLRLFGWLVGYVIVEVTGESVERFMNLCAVTKKDVWDFVLTDKGISMKVRVSEFKGLRSAARKAGVKMHICSKHGLLFCCRPLIKRWGLVIGICLFFVLLQFLSSRIWLIEIKGNEQVNKVEIEELLQGNGIKQGISAEQFHWATVRQEILSEYPQISWMSFNPQGSILHVDISETTLPPEESADHEPGNIVASCDGRIVEMQVYTGKAAVQVGDAVVKGDMLINGAVEYSDGSTVFRKATGKVLAETVHKYEVFIPFRQQVLQPTGKTTRRKVLCLFGLEIPLYLGSVEPPYEKKSRTDVITIKNVPLPIGVKTGEFYHSQSLELSIGEEEAKRQGKEKVEKYIGENLKDAKIQNVKYDYNLTKEGVQVKSEIFCIENIIFHEKLLIF